MNFHLSSSFFRVAFDILRMYNKYPRMDEKYIRNLLKSTINQKYWLIDNEMAMLEGYRSAYNHLPIQRQFQTDMLHVMCMFQRSLVDRVRELNLFVEPHSHLIDFATKHDPDYANIPYNDNDFSIFDVNFKNRIEDVYNWIENCAN